MRTFEEFHDALNGWLAAQDGNHYNDLSARDGVHHMKRFLEDYLKSEEAHVLGLCTIAARGGVGLIAYDIMEACRHLIPEVRAIWGPGVLIGGRSGRTPERVAVAGIILGYLREVTK